MIPIARPALAPVDMPPSLELEPAVADAVAAATVPLPADVAREAVDCDDLDEVEGRPSVAASGIPSFAGSDVVCELPVAADGAPLLVRAALADVGVASSPPVRVVYPPITPSNVGDAV